MAIWKHADIPMHPILSRQHHNRAVLHHAELAVQAFKQRLPVVLLSSSLKSKFQKHAECQRKCQSWIYRVQDREASLLHWVCLMTRK